MSVQPIPVDWQNALWMMFLVFLAGIAWTAGCWVAHRLLPKS